MTGVRSDLHFLERSQGNELTEQAWPLRDWVSRKATMGGAGGAEQGSS